MPEEGRDDLRETIEAIQESLRKSFFDLLTTEVITTLVFLFINNLVILINLYYSLELE